MVLYNFALIKDRLTFIILNIFEPVTSYSTKSIGYSLFTNVFSGQVQIIFKQVVNSR